MLGQLDRQSVQFSISEARAHIADLFHPKPWIYWTDFLLSITFAYAFYGLTRRMPAIVQEPVWAGFLLQFFCFVASCILIYRSAIFIHELVHLKSNEFKWFRIVWNLLCGIPFLTPSFLYYSHHDHHMSKHYGTDRDGEYLPLAHRPPRMILLLLLESLLFPLVVILRFTLLTPMAWVSPRFRRWLHRHLSSLVIDPSYIRPIPTEQALRMIRLQEAMCFLWCVSIVVVARVFFDRWPLPFLAQAYLTAAAIGLLNAIRTLGAHRYANDGESISFAEQMTDSLNFPHRPWITELWGPIGTRYHALHHLFPSLPYHAFPEAHRRLMKHLPADSPYRETERVSLIATVIALFRLSKFQAEKSRQLISNPQQLSKNSL